MRLILCFPHIMMAGGALSKHKGLLSGTDKTKKDDMFEFVKEAAWVRMGLAPHAGSGPRSMQLPDEACGRRPCTYAPRKRCSMRWELTSSQCCGPLARRHLRTGSINSTLQRPGTCGTSLRPGWRG